ncbi:MAG TPA: class I SAM-dependent methyltransferase [Bradyrhizobium sp.]|nr:class I SAM-dependent methyltransferase [Bradyrhizobium sp.]
MSHSAETNNTSSRPDFYEPLRKVLPIAEQVQGLFLYRARTAILQTLKNSGAHTVLDVCCGSGCLTCRLSRAGFEVTGVDSSPTMLTRAKTKHRGARFVLCDASQMPYAAAFDAAAVSLALHEMEPPLRESVWETMRHAVRPGGLLIALDFTIPKDSKWHSRLIGRFIDKDERQVGRINPAHYENYREFMGTGGLEGWLGTRERSAMTKRFFAGGNLGVFVVAA